MSTTSNPAARLHNLLRQAITQAGSMRPKGNRQNRVRSRDVWAEVLGAQDDASLLRQMAAIFGLPSEIRRQVQLTPVATHEPFLKHLPSIEKSFTAFGLATHWEQFISPIDEAALSGLEVCASLLETHFPEPVLPDGSLDKIIEGARSLLDEVVAADDLDSNVRTFLAETLSDLLRALDDYRISGLPPIQKVIDATVGEYRRTEDKPAKTPVGKKVLAFLGGLALLLDIVNGAYDAAEKYDPLLPWDIPPNVEIVPGDLQPKALPGPPKQLGPGEQTNTSS